MIETDPIVQPRPTAALVDISIPRSPALWAYLGQKFEVPKGTPVHVRDQGDVKFVSLKLDDTLLFPRNHETMAGLARYDWVPDPDRPAIQLGTLVPAAQHVETKP